MAPDINSLPPSPYRNPASTTTPRRPSQTRRLSERMVVSPSGSLFSSTPPPRSPNATSTTFNQPLPREDNTGVDPGPGPLRHPRPLTAADLHMQLEKEQEAVVNRLTRELTLLRQQTASTISNTSSTSASTGIADSAVQGPDGGVSLNSNIHLTPSRRHRSSSNLSSRGAASASSTGATAGSTSTVNTTTGLTGSGIAPPRDSSYSYSRGGGGDPLSRQSSVASRRSDASSPSLSSSLFYTGAEQHPFPASSHHRHSHSNSLSTSGASAAGMVRGGNYVPSTHRYDEAAHARAELDMVKAENEALKGRIRELERLVRQSSVAASRQSESTQSTRSASRTGLESRASGIASMGDVVGEIEK